jgi:hypothetical protein
MTCAYRGFLIVEKMGVFFVEQKFVTMGPFLSMNACTRWIDEELI